LPLPDGVQGRVGEGRVGELGLYAVYAGASPLGGGMLGASSMIEAGLDSGSEDVEG
jgi:hypothetical protein